MGLGTHSHPTDNSFWSDTSVGLLHCVSAEGIHLDCFMKPNLLQPVYIAIKNENLRHL